MSRHFPDIATKGALAAAVAITALAPAVPAAMAGEPAASPPPHGIVEPVAPWNGWAVDAESSILWRITDSTPLNYTLFTEAISLRTPQHIRLDCGDGNLVVRSNFTLLGELFIDGPETYYVGFSASPSIEYWFPGDRTHVYFSAGGGVGWVDSTDVEGGQGQDFTLNWFIKSGVRHAVNDRLSISCGIFFQHLSNGGQSDRNPGLDALGPSIGVSWKL